MSAQQATSDVQRTSSSQEPIKIDEMTSVPAELFDELMRAAEKTRAGGQHMLVQNSRGVQRLKHMSFLQRPKKCTNRGPVFSNVTDMSKQESLSSLEKVTGQVSRQDVFSSVKLHLQSVPMPGAFDERPSSLPRTKSVTALDDVRGAFEKSWRMC